MNTEQLEQELRETLTAAADELPASAGSRVRTHAYRPRTRSLRPPVAAGALTVAAVAGAAVWVVGFSQQTSPAFAGWTATPTAGSRAQRIAAESTCRRIVRSPATVRAQTGGGPPPAGTIDLGHLRPVLTDTRGPFTWAIFAGANDSASCIDGPSLTMVAASGGVNVTAPRGRIALTSASQTKTPAGNAYSFVEGRAGSGVTAATLVLSDDARVQATIQNGWFVAWWPGAHTAHSALVRTALGTTSQALPAHSGPACAAMRKPTAGLRTCTSRSTFGPGHHGHTAGFSASSVGTSTS